MSRILAHAPVLGVVLVLLVGMSSGCKTPNEDLDKLRAENEKLQQQLAQLQGAAGEAPEPLTPISSFTVGLAASEKDFDEAAFEKMLSENLDTAAREAGVRVAAETDPRQVQKIRGMLIQQYLAADEVPVVITNLSFKLRDAKHSFKIGGQVVPRAGIKLELASAGQVANAVHSGAIATVMRRGTGNGFTIPYEELGGGKGSVEIKIRESEILDTQPKPRAERQGDLSFNWQLNLEKVNVYRVEGFRGDVGKFLSFMRYSGDHSAIGKYQTLRDFVFLFGYGSYVTGLVNQIRTPSRINAVEVLPIDKDVFAKLQGRLTEKEVVELVGTSANWQQCKFVDFSNSEKIWERPPGVGFPFVSRQIAGERKRVFYLKYDTNGAFFVGDFER